MAGLLNPGNRTARVDCRRAHCVRADWSPSASPPWSVALRTKNGQDLREGAHPWHECIPTTPPGDLYTTPVSTTPMTATGSPRVRLIADQASVVVSQKDATGWTFSVERREVFTNRYHMTEHPLAAPRRTMWGAVHR